MRHGSLFAGIEGFGYGFERAGWQTVWQVEQEPFCLAVLETRFPKAQRFKDIRECGAHNLEAVDCITAGVPCQDVSVAGKRAGLAGERTGLFYEFARILRELRPAWFVFENVPGLLSSNRGRDFAEVLRVLMVECGYGVCWRVLDSQFFGVAQRRRRVFIVGSLGRPCPAEVLFEPASGSGDIAPGKEARQGAAGEPARRTDIVGQAISSKWSKGSSGPAGDEHHNLVAGPLGGSARSGGFQPNAEQAAEGHLVAASLRSADGHHGRSSPRGDGCDNLVAALTPVRGGPDDNDAQAGHIVIQDVRGHREKKQHGIGIQEGGPSYTLGAVERHAVAFRHYADHQQGELQQPATGRSVSPVGSGSARASGSVCGEDAGKRPDAGDIRGTGLRAGGQQCRRTDAFKENHAPDERAATDADGVRDFAGLPEGLDSARYRALGNAVTTQVAEWIGRRIRAAGELR